MRAECKIKKCGLHESDARHLPESPEMTPDTPDSPDTKAIRKQVSLTTN